MMGKLRGEGVALPLYLFEAGRLGLSDFCVDFVHMLPLHHSISGHGLALFIGGS